MGAKEFLCPTNTSLNYGGEIRLPSLDEYVDTGEARFNVVGKVGRGRCTQAAPT